MACAIANLGSISTALCRNTLDGGPEATGRRHGSGRADQRVEGAPVATRRRAVGVDDAALRGLASTMLREIADGLRIDCIALLALDADEAPAPHYAWSRLNNRPFEGPTFQSLKVFDARLASAPSGLSRRRPMPLRS